MPSPIATRAHESLAVLLRTTQLSTADALPDAVARAWARLDVSAVMYVADDEQRMLVPLLPSGSPPRAPVEIAGTLAGRAFRLTQPVPVKESDAPRLWLPLLDGLERLGVLEVALPAGADPDDRELREALAPLVSLTGHMLVIKQMTGDAVDRVRQARPRTVAADLVWTLLPELTFGTERVVVSGLTQPCHDVGGDVFDYAVNGDVTHLAILDAMGHSLSAGLTAATALSSYRNCRRAGRGLLDTALVVDEVIEQQFGGERFATGVLAQLDLETGRLRYLAAGHPHPLVLRGAKVVKTLLGGRRPPLGLGYAEGSIAEEWLEPGDALLLYTDGVTEARDATGREFGVDRLIDLLERHAADRLPSPEMLRHLAHAVLAHQHGELHDDATLLIAHWTSDAPRTYRLA